MNRSVHAVTAGAFLHRVAETFYDLAMPLLVLKLTGSAVLMSVMFGLGFVAELLVSMFGGTFIDRMDRRKLLITVAAAEVLTMGVAGTAYSLDVLSVPALIGLAFVIDGLVRLSITADSSILPQLVDREQVPRASGRLQMALSTAQALGPAMAGACVVLAGLGGTLWITAGAFLPLLGLVFLVKWPAREPVTAEAGAGIVGFAKSSWHGMAFTFSNRMYRALLLWRGVFDFAYGAVYLMLIYYFQHQRHLSGAEIGLIATFGALGGLAGGAMFARVQAHFRSGTLLLCSALIMAAASALLPFTGDWPVLGLLLAVLMFFGALVGRLTGLLFQTTVPAEYLGRVISATQLISTATGPVSVLLAGWLSQNYGASTVFFGGSAVVVLLVVASLRSRIATADWGVQRRARPTVDEVTPAVAA
jgi:MFS family permease